MRADECEDGAEDEDDDRADEGYEGEYSEAYQYGREDITVTGRRHRACDESFTSRFEVDTRFDVDGHTREVSRGVRWGSSSDGSEWEINMTVSRRLRS